MKDLDIFFDDGELTNYLQNNKEDPWLKTNFEGYLNLTNRKKGIFGDKFVSKIMKMKYNSKVLSPTNDGHDRIIDGYKTEIKFSLSLIKDKFMFNHISCNKDWERLLLLGINKDNYYMNWISKEDFIRRIDIFSYQQGGKEIKNDDFMFVKKYSVLESSGILQHMENWFKNKKEKFGLELLYA